MSSHPKSPQVLILWFKMFHRLASKTAEAFTLIELLIVVAIIAILALIAMPNFLEAQTRAKVTRTKADARTLAVAAQAYYVDNNAYPVPGDAFYMGLDVNWDVRQMRMTTPIAYITSLPRDAFGSNHEHNPHGLYDFEVHGGIQGNWFLQDPPGPILNMPIEVYIRSWGPDQDQEFPPWSVTHSVYDPTNGTISRGDIWALLPGPAYYPR